LLSIFGVDTQTSTTSPSPSGWRHVPRAVLCQPTHSDDPLHASVACAETFAKAALAMGGGTVVSAWADSDLARYRLHDEHTYSAGTHYGVDIVYSPDCQKLVITITRALDALPLRPALSCVEFLFSVRWLSVLRVRQRSRLLASCR